MNRSLITSLTNPLIKEAALFASTQSQGGNGIVRCEGLHHVGEALEAGWEIDSILYSPDVLTSDFGRDLISKNESKVQQISAQVMESIADKENPQGMIAVVHQKSDATRGFEIVKVWRGNCLAARPGQCRNDFAHA